MDYKKADAIFSDKTNSFLNFKLDSITNSAKYPNKKHYDPYLETLSNEIKFLEENKGKIKDFNSQNSIVEARNNMNKLKANLDQGDKLKVFE